MSFLLDNWKFVLIGLLVAGNVLFWNLWQSKAEELAIYKAKVEVLGKAAEEHAKEIEAAQEKTRKEIEDEWNKKLPKIREDAVAAFKRKYSGNGLLLKPGGGQVSGLTDSATRTNGTAEESMADSGSKCPDEFISDSAEDAFKVELWREWARQNKIPVK